MPLSEQEIIRLKQEAAYYALSFVQPGMVVGLGTGSTAIWAVRRLAELLREGVLRDIVGIPTSAKTEDEARLLGIPLTTLDDHPQIDVTIDGADEVDPQLNLIKGGGAALLREKIVAQVTQREIIVVDDSKLSPLLGTRFPVPVEVIPFGWKSQRAYLEALGAQVTVRQDVQGGPLQTDGGNLILDCRFGPIADLTQLVGQLERRAGIVEHGIFLGMTRDVIVAGDDGVRHLQSGRGLPG